MGNHLYTLLIGSNHLATKHIPQALELLENTFGIIRCTSEMLTEAINMPNDFPFVNKAVCVHSTLEATEMIAMLKSIEKQLGRCDEDKQRGIIPIDIDIILCDKKVLHADYETKKYVKKLVKEVCLE